MKKYLIQFYSGTDCRIERYTDAYDEMLALIKVKEELGFLTKDWSDYITLKLRG